MNTFEAISEQWLENSDTLPALVPIAFPDMTHGIPVQHGPHLTKEQGKQLELLNEKGVGK